MVFPYSITLPKMATPAYFPNKKPPSFTAQRFHNLLTLKNDYNPNPIIMKKNLSSVFLNVSVEFLLCPVATYLADLLPSVR